MCIPILCAANGNVDGDQYGSGKGREGQGGKSIEEGIREGGHKRSLLAVGGGLAAALGGLWLLLLREKGGYRWIYLVRGR